MAFRRDTETSTLNMGWIPYWNLNPLKQELMRSLGSNISFHPGHPTVINRMLSDGVVSVAPCSSVCLLKNTTHEMAAPIGVASNGAVQSVYLGLSKDTAFVAEAIKDRVATLREIVGQGIAQYGDSLRRVAKYVWDCADELPAKDFDFSLKLRLSPDSASSVALAKIFYRLVFGSGAYEAQVANTLPSAYMQGPAMELVIGDEALSRRPEFAKVIDLGHFWHQLTGLPFVFAVWQKSNRSLQPTWSARIIEAAEMAQTRMHVEPSVYYPKNLPLNQLGREIDLGAYWKNIHYRLGPKDISGLLLFLCLARLMVKADIDDAMVVRMLRWQQMGDYSRSAIANH